MIEWMKKNKLSNRKVAQELNSFFEKNDRPNRCIHQNVHTWKTGTNPTPKWRDDVGKFIAEFSGWSSAILIDGVIYYGE